MIHSIESAQHPLVKHLTKLQKSRAYRYEEGRLVIEGRKMVGEVCCHHPALHLLFTDESLIPEGISAHQLYRVSEPVMKKVSSLSSSEGIAAEVEMPPYSTLEGCRRILVLDRINDPGNLGTLIRTALAFGWDGIYLLEKTCDPYNEKALRAAKGGTFRLPLDGGTSEQFKEFAEETGLQVLAADLHGNQPEEIPRRKRVALILGNEAEGVSKELKEIGTPVNLPQSDRMESLNVSVAGGILMYLIGQDE